MNNSTKNLFDSFLLPQKRSSATHHLADMGDAAITLVSLAMNGELCNEYGHPYRNIGALDCILVTCKLLKIKYGKLPDSLELKIRTEMDKGNVYAIEYFA